MENELSSVVVSSQTGSYAYVISNHAYGAVRSELVNVTAGTQYDVYTYLRGEIDPDDSGGAWKIQVQYFNSSNTYLSSSDVDSGSSLNTTWQQEGGRITVPSGVAKLQVLLYSYQNNGWVAFDDVSLKQVGNSTNLLANPGFESSGNWTTDSYADFPATAYWRHTWGTAAPRTGSYAYTISNHAYGNLTSTAIPASPNTDYDLYALVRGELDAEDSEGGAWQARLYYLDANNTQIGGYDVLHSAVPGSLSTAWQEVGGRITTPAGTASIKILLYNYLNSGWVAVDNVRLSRPTDATIQRITYHMGGRAIATRIVGDPTSSNNGLFYLYSDHLNSTSVMSYYKLDDGSNHSQIGQAVTGSRARYLPFGGWRTEPTASLTDMGFTSHKTNNTGSGDIGLIYMNARYYLPSSSRFISADTIIPDPANPQSWNRYSYVENNPTRYTDPSGHCIVVCLIAIGAGLGVIADYAIQVHNNIQSGMNPWDAVHYPNIDESEMVGAAVAGGTSTALTLAAAPVVAPAIVEAAGLTGATATTVTVGTTALVGAGANATGDFSGRVVQSALGSPRDDIFTLSTYKSSLLWGAISGTASSSFDELIAKPLTIRATSQAQASFIGNFKNNAAIELWDHSINTNVGWPPPPNDLTFLDLYLKMNLGPTPLELSTISQPPLAQLASTASYAVSIATNSSIGQALWDIFME